MLDIRVCVCVVCVCACFRQFSPWPMRWYICVSVVSCALVTGLQINWQDGRLLEDSLFMFVSASVGLSVCLSISLALSLSVPVCVCMSVCLSVCLSVCT